MLNNCWRESLSQRSDETIQIVLILVLGRIPQFRQIIEHSLHGNAVVGGRTTSELVAGTVAAARHRQLRTACTFANLLVTGQLEQVQ